MTNEERSKKLKDLIKNCEQQIKKLSTKIDELSKTKKAERENREEIKELYKDIGEWEHHIDSYYFIGHELEIF